MPPIIENCNFYPYIDTDLKKMSFPNSLLSFRKSKKMFFKVILVHHINPPPPMAWDAFERVWLVGFNDFLQALEQEVIDMTNAIAKDGFVFFPEFCSVCLKKFREEDEDQFAQLMFKVKNQNIGF